MIGPVNSPLTGQSTCFFNRFALILRRSHDWPINGKKKSGWLVAPDSCPIDAAKRNWLGKESITTRFGGLRRRRTVLVNARRQGSSNRANNVAREPPSSRRAGRPHIAKAAHIGGPRPSRPGCGLSSLHSHRLSRIDVLVVDDRAMAPLSNPSDGTSGPKSGVGPTGPGRPLRPRFGKATIDTRGADELPFHPLGKLGNP